MLRFTYSLLLFIGLFAQDRIIVLDTETRKPIGKVEVKYLESVRYTDNKGKLKFSRLAIGDTLILSHVSYDKRVYVISNMSSVFRIQMKPIVLVSDEQVVEGEVDLAVSEQVFSEQFRDSLVLRASPSLTDYMARSSQIDFVENVGQEKTIRLIGSHENELLVRLNQISLFSHTHGTNQLQNIIPLSIEKISLGLGNEYAYTGVMDANFNYKERLIDVGFGENKLATSILYNIPESGLLVSAKSEINKDLLEYTQHGETYTYKARNWFNGVNLVQIKEVGDLTFRSTLLASMEDTDYLLDAGQIENNVTINVSAEQTELFSAELGYTFLDKAYSNTSNKFSVVTIDDVIGELNGRFRYLGFSDYGLTPYTEFLVMNHTLNKKSREDIKPRAGLRFKHINEDGSVLEAHSSIDRHNGKIFISSLGFKNNFKFLSNHARYQMYFDFNASQQPIFEVQSLYFDDQFILNSPTLSYNQKIIFGFRFGNDKASIDVNYSNKVYENNTYKVYSLLDYKLRTYELAKSEAINLELTYKLNTYFQAQFSGYYSSFSPAFAFINRPESSANVKLLFSRNHHSASLNYNYGANIFNMYIAGDFYREQRIKNITRTDLSYGFNQLFEVIDLNFSIFNLFANDIIISNGFVHNRREVNMSFTYAF